MYIYGVLVFYTHTHTHIINIVRSRRVERVGPTKEQGGFVSVVRKRLHRTSVFVHPGTETLGLPYPKNGMHRSQWYGSLASIVVINDFTV